MEEVILTPEEAAERLHESILAADYDDLALAVSELGDYDEKTVIVRDEYASSSPCRKGECVHGSGSRGRLTKRVTMMLTVQEFYLVLDAMGDLLDECEQMADCGDEWGPRHERAKRLVERLQKIEQLEIIPH